MNKELNDVSYVINIDSVPVVKFHPFDDMDWLNCGFSTRIGGVSTGCHESLNLGYERGDKRENVTQNFRRFADSAGFDADKICFPAQWHTNNIRTASFGNCAGELDVYSEKYKEAEVQKQGGNVSEDKLKNAIDGQITDEAGIVIISYGADCTPIYLADPVHKAIGLVHSGWKGTLNSICSDALKMMNEHYNTRASDIVAVIGPSIASGSYEVGYDVAGYFIEKHGIKVTDDSAIVRLGRVVTKPASSDVPRVSEQKYQLDLWEANMQNLSDFGVPYDHIFFSGLDTFTEKEMFFSHRRDGNARGVMAGYMCIR